MKLRQLQYVCEVAKRGCNISAAAASLHTAQSGISKQLKLLEDEIGTPLFHRLGNKLSGLTPSGETIAQSAQRVMQEVTFIKAFGAGLEKKNEGTLTVATTHTQSRYVLPAIVKRFNNRYPKVRVTLRHANPAGILELLNSGEADVGVTTAAPVRDKSLIVLPSHRFERVVIVPAGHPLLRQSEITLKSVARYPLVTYDSGYTGREDVLKTFSRAGLTPHIALSAADADVIKSCVEQDLGIAVLLGVIFDNDRDKGLRQIPAGHLFPPAKINVVVAKRHYFRNFDYHFVEMLSGRWRKSDIQKMTGQSH